MKNILRKLSLKKKDWTCKEFGEYIVIYNTTCGATCERITKDELKDLLLNPYKTLKYIFKYEDRLNIITEFEEMEDGDKNENDNNV